MFFGQIFEIYYSIDNFTGKNIEIMAITNTSNERISKIAAAQKEFFRSGKTLDIKYRLSALHALKSAIQKWEKPLAEALWRDLHKSYEEAYLTELSIVLAEIDNHIKHLISTAELLLNAESV